MTEYPELQFKWDWHPVDGVRAQELRATWARLEIWADGDCITLVEDRESSSSRRSVFLPLYPLAEWVAFNWRALLADTRPAGYLSKLRAYGDRLFDVATKARFERHSLRHAGDGFLWPNLLVLPQGDTVRLIWKADSTTDPDRPVRYLTTGDCTTSADHVKQCLGHLVESVITRLDELQISGTALQEEWEAIQSADESEVAYCMAAARLGLDPYADAAEHEAEILRAAEVLEEDLLKDFLEAVEPSRITENLDWVTKTLQDIKQLSTGTGRIHKVRVDVRRVAGEIEVASRCIRPWEIGWEQARIVRRVLSVSEESKFRLDDLLASVERSSPTQQLQAVGTGQTKSSDPLVAVGRAQRSSTRRFTLARALWHVLWGESNSFLVTSAYTDRQKIERAFAAELLAPASGIAAQLDDFSSAAIDDDRVEELASTYDVSSILIARQIQNQVLLSKY